jgi:lauroyl/myristoyl acyltransferase
MAFSDSAEQPNSNPSERILTVGWHFPEYPYHLQSAVSAGALILVAQRSDWMYSAVPHSNLFCFRGTESMTPLVRAFRNGRQVVVMMDYCYDETSHTVVNFLGYPARTPSGVLTLAARFGYQITSGNHTERCSLVEAKVTGTKSVPELALAINSHLEQEILAAPAEWLLWASVDRRWIGVDYES